MRPTVPIQNFLREGRAQSRAGAKLTAFQTYRAHIYGRFGDAHNAP